MVTLASTAPNLALARNLVKGGAILRSTQLAPTCFQKSNILIYPYSTSSFEHPRFYGTLSDHIGQKTFKKKG